MENNISQAFNSKENLEAVSTIIYMMAKNNCGVDLDGSFSQTLMQTMNQIHNKFGRKPNNISDQDHLKNLNKLVIDDCLKYITSNNNNNPNNNQMTQYGINPQFNQMNPQQQFNPNMNPSQMNPQQFNQNMNPSQMNPQQFNQQFNQMFNKLNPHNPQTMFQGQEFSNPGQGALPGQLPVMNHNPFPSQQSQSADLSKLIDNLAYERGYNLPPEQVMTPRLDFTMPMQPHGLDPNSIMDKIKQERGMLGQNGLPFQGQKGAGGMNLNEMMGTAAPQGNQQQGGNINPNQQMPSNPYHQQSQQGGIENFLNAPERPKKQDALDQMITSQEQERELRRNAKFNQGNGGQQVDENGQPMPEDDDAAGEYYRRLQAIKDRYNPNESTNDTISNNGHYPQQQPYANGSGQIRESFLSLDMRQDLRDIDGSKYRLAFSEYRNVAKVELVSLMMTTNEYLEQEPYIYFNIGEIEGNYQLSNQLKVFGKLFPTKHVGNFIEFRPEKCVKLFDSPQSFYQFTFGFQKFDQKPIPLHKINIKKVVKQLATNQLKIVTKTPHHLSIDEEVNISTYEKNQTTVNSFKVLDVVDNKTFIIENIYENISPSLILERRDIKCSLTFKIFHY